MSKLGYWRRPNDPLQNNEIKTLQSMTPQGHGWDPPEVRKEKKEKNKWVKQVRIQALVEAIATEQSASATFFFFFGRL